MGVPQNQYFRIENPIEMDDFRGTPTLGNPQMVGSLDLPITGLTSHQVQPCAVDACQCSDVSWFRSVFCFGYDSGDRINHPIWA